MSTNSLQKQYNALKPWERIPLVLASLKRDDKSDLENLISSAPKIACQMNDYYFNMKALHEVAMIHYCHQLELVAKLMKAMWYRAETGGMNKKQAALANKAILKLRREMAWCHMAWLSMCKDLNIDATTILSLIFDMSIVQEQVTLSLELYTDVESLTANEEREAYIEGTVEAYKAFLFRHQSAI